MRRPRYYFILVKNEFILKRGPEPVEQILEKKVDEALDKLIQHYGGEVVDWSHPQAGSIYDLAFHYFLGFVFFYCMSAT